MMRQLLRALVLHTNAYWPLKQCHRAIYSAALACFLRCVVRNRPMVRSVYVRRSQNAKDWIPGLSDIDLTLILDAGLSPEAEYRELVAFWAAYQRLKMLFPMFGEVEILNQHEFGGWLASTSYRPGRRAWTLVYGEPNANLEIGAPPGWRVRALNLAWWIYEDLLPPCFAQPDSFVRNQDLQRRIKKILRLLAPLLPDAGQSELNLTQSSDPADLVAGALKALENAVVQVLPIQPRQLGHGESPQMIQSRFDQGRMLILEDGLDMQVLARVISKNRRAYGSAPLVLPRCLLEYRVRFYNPYDYSMIARDWAATPGNHPLEDVVPPGAAEFLQYSLHRIRTLQVASRGEEFFTKPLSVKQVRRPLVGVAALELLRNGRVLSSQNEVWARWLAEFPEYEQAVEKLGGLIGQDRLQEARRECFLLFRSIANQLGPFLDAPNPQQERLASTASVK